jgi:electron transfer flavoprotein beta subunit
MKVLVLLRMVPDVVEELEVAPTATSLNDEFLRLIINESDNHALEQALLLKERHGGTVTVVAMDQPEIDDVLFTALAKGADRAVKITGASRGMTTRQAASLLSKTLTSAPDVLPVDAIITGCQAIDDLDGQAAPLVAYDLKLPCLGLVTAMKVDPSARKATVIREYAGGVRGEFEMPVPAVFGIQVAERPPRYVPVAKVRAVAKSQKIETIAATAMPEVPVVSVVEMKKPQATGHAEMIGGSPEEIAERICGILVERGLL